MDCKIVTFLMCFSIKRRVPSLSWKIKFALIVLPLTDPWKRVFIRPCAIQLCDVGCLNMFNNAVNTIIHVHVNSEHAYVSINKYIEDIEWIGSVCAVSWSIMCLKHCTCICIVCSQQIFQHALQANIRLANRVSEFNTIVCLLVEGS